MSLPEKMHMQVGDGLTAIVACVDHHAVAVFQPLLPRDLSG